MEESPLNILQHGGHLNIGFNVEHRPTASLSARIVEECVLENYQHYTLRREAHPAYRSSSCHINIDIVSTIKYPGVQPLLLGRLK